ncbi:MAG: PIG-L family deacetylase [Chloroflexi bacterium]|nr:PIG-L family deacetylase [Chloroflexota bacterium]MCL4509353.1 PIG-L family deacetylase [Chloroflexota bacterium]
MARVLTVLAHPDDAEIWAGGTIASNVRSGGSALICSLTGHPDSLRGREAAEGAQALGAELVLLNQPDRQVTITESLVKSLGSLLLDFQPNIIITHWEEDSHPDHIQTHDAIRAAIVATAGRSQSIDLFLQCDTYLGTGKVGLFTPELYLDVSEVWPQKLDAIRKHASQDPEHYVEITERQCWLHGARSKVRYAEGFRRIPVYGRLGGALHQLI